VANLIDSSLVVIEGEVRSLDATLETLGKRKKSSKECQNKTNDSNNLFQQQYSANFHSVRQVY